MVEVVVEGTVVAEDTVVVQVVDVVEEVDLLSDLWDVRISYVELTVEDIFFTALFSDTLVIGQYSYFCFKYFETQKMADAIYAQSIFIWTMQLL